jgi:four helix bundle protein
MSPAQPAVHVPRDCGSVSPAQPAVHVSPAEPAVHVPVPRDCGSVSPAQPAVHVPVSRDDGSMSPAQPAVHVSRDSASVPAHRDAADSPTPSPACEPEPILDAEKLEVYQVALELQALASTLVPPNHRVLHDQLERASLSVVLNIAEGAGRRSRKDKRRFYAMARGSACECAAAVDVLRHRHLSPKGACATARSLALRVIQMLTKLDRALV